MTTQRDYFRELGYEWDDELGRPVKKKKPDAVADGEVIRTQMMCRDDQSRDQAARDAFDYMCAAPGFIPTGGVTVIDDSDPRIKAYNAYDKRISESWMHRGQPTTHADGGEQHLRQQKERAIADGRHEDARQLAYQLYDMRISNAWQQKGR
jgi:hypothetical protein